ncbi:VOC family protein [Peterkaempfera griseoplana]|uniref:VOC family protein n=1 Tax=Peterkaempfera griseoplana TaxID=66896 RepID=UPI0006E17757|nr:VOC family protein [Peterkaempfera griseoplana]
MITAVDHVQLAARPGTEDDLRAYYAGVLGMTEVPKPAVLAAGGGCWFQAGAVQLHLGMEDGHTPSAKAHPALRVTGIRRYAEQLVRRGARVQWDRGLPGVLRFYSWDPAGNRIEFLEADSPAEP